jgi:hypothetical protein
MSNTNDHPPEDGKQPSHQQRCLFCGRFFRPNPHVGTRQISCSEPDCQKRRKREQERRWKENNPECFKKEDAYEYLKEWRKNHPDYQKTWRARRRGEIKTQSAVTVKQQKYPMKSIRIHLRLPQPLSEIKTQSIRITRSGSAFWVDGLSMPPARDNNADGGTSPD